MEEYSFDGVDIDWEYPVVNGLTADTANFVSLVSDMRAAFGTTYGISITLPITESYLQSYNVLAMEPYVDWFNVMSYDLSGPWDATDGQGAYLRPPSNLTVIDQKLEAGLWRLNVTMSKLNFGLAYYGRSFQLASASCQTPGCAWSGVGTEGSCSLDPGVLMNAEIRTILANSTITPTVDTTAAVNYFTNNGNWVSYDSQATFAIKQAYANSHCFGGTFIWDLTQANAQYSSNPALRLMVAGTGAYY